jgi:hypothetical protein
MADYNKKQQRNRKHGGRGPCIAGFSCLTILIVLLLVLICSVALAVWLSLSQPSFRIIPASENNETYVFFKAVGVPASPYFTASETTDFEKCLYKCGRDSQCVLAQVLHLNETCHLYNASSFSFVMPSLYEAGQVIWQKSLR